MIKLYNTLLKEKEEFIPIDKENKIVSIYSCGPTVYNYAHIGNMRAYIFMDTLRKMLEYNGYQLNHVMNITDVGHLTSDADEGEDKMAKSARLQHKSVYEIAHMYTEAFLEDMKRLQIEMPEHVEKVTDHIQDMEQYVKEIMENGYAYETSKGIYFDTSKLESYGELSKVNLEGQKAGARVGVDLEKRNPHDFALWIKAPKEHIMKWDSQWGVSYPGWHIECSALSRMYLGETFDIHTGGVDHIPIHHENEIAQSRGATGKNPAHFWMHVEFLLIDNGKMSKSLNNVYTIEELEKHGIEPLAYRYFTYTSHYRNKLNFTWESIRSAQIALTRLREAAKIHEQGTAYIDQPVLQELEQKFIDAINDDLNLPVAMAVVWEVAKQSNKSKAFYQLLLKMDQVLSLGLDKKPKEKDEEIIPEEIAVLVEKRKQAREDKNFALSDEIRDILKEKGYLVIDSKEGQKIEKV